jgi:hypothetical protein
MKYRFTYILEGVGETEEQCLANALEAFESDPGTPTYATRIWEDNGIAGEAEV